jgi:uncharacterized RDD family membrane protein YckC
VDDRSPADEPTPCRIPVHHLSVHQVELLRTVLRAGDVPFGISRGEVVAPAEHTDEILKAVAWAGVDPTLSDEFDDPDHHPVKRPLVKPPRGPLRDGRMEATRWRRLSAGVLDEALIAAPLVLATEAGAPVWTCAVMHAVYHVAPTSLYGWSIGKLWCGLRVIDAVRLCTPDPVHSVIRWAVAAVPLMAGLLLGMTGTMLTALILVVHGPILFDLRGLHDYAAGTRVVERSPAGPGIWVRSSGRARTIIR